MNPIEGTDPPGEPPNRKKAARDDSTGGCGEGRRNNINQQPRADLIESRVQEKHNVKNNSETNFAERQRRWQKQQDEVKRRLDAFIEFLEYNAGLFPPSKK